MNECREAREQQEEEAEEAEEGEGEQERPDLPSRMRTLFRSRFPPSPHRPPSLARPTHGTRAHEDNMGPHRAHGCPRTVTHATYVCRAHARAHALVRVLNNAYGDRVWLSCTPKDTHARDRFVWTRKTTLLGDRREREFSGSVPTNNR